MFLYSVHKSEHYLQCFFPARMFYACSILVSVQYYSKYIVACHLFCNACQLKIVQFSLVVSVPARK